jgi:hypothetical protein
LAKAWYRQDGEFRVAAQEWCHQLKHEGGGAVLATLEALDLRPRNASAGRAVCAQQRASHELSALSSQRLADQLWPHRVGVQDDNRVKPKRDKLAARYGHGETFVDVGAVHEFAAEFREKNKSKWIQAERLGGSCLLVK